MAAAAAAAAAVAGLAVVPTNSFTGLRRLCYIPAPTMLELPPAQFLKLWTIIY